MSDSIDAANAAFDSVNEVADDEPAFATAIPPGKTVLEHARDYSASGISTLPIRADGTKAPPAGLAWKQWQAQQPTAAEIEQNFRKRVGIGVICGRVSGNLEVVDVDDAELFPEFSAEAERLSPGLLAKLTTIRTPRGYHLAYRCMTIEGNQKLAERGRDDPKFTTKKTLIETRGEGGYVVAPGSPPECHQDRAVYRHVGGPALTAVPMISPAERANLFRAARSFNRLVDESDVTGPRASNGRQTTGLSPGDDYNARAVWSEILAPHGWTVSGSRGGVQHWTRPGKTDGSTSATTGLNSTGGTELLCVFSSNAYPFDIPAGKTCGTYSKFAAFTVLNHGGDYAKAARALAELGYGEKASKQPGHSGQVRERADHHTDHQPHVADHFGQQQEPDEEPAERFTIKRLSSAEFDSGDYTQNYLIDDVLAEGQPLVIAAQLKTMKTTLAVALGISLALGRAFLGKFWVREAVNVLLISGESGLSTLQSAGRRIARSYGYSLGDVGRLFWSTDLPRLGSFEHLEAIREALISDEIAVLICDPLYFMLPGQDAGNLMIIGAYLRTLSALCEEVGVTLIVVHHIKKSGIDNKHDPPELSQISWSGTAEWCRQWLLLSRREPYTAGTGEHRLWMVTGGSAGHSGLHALDIREGVGDARCWEVDVLSPDDVRQGGDDAKEQSREAKRLEQVERDKRAILTAVVKLPGHQGTKTDIKDRTGRNPKAFDVAFAELIDAGDLVACEIKKTNGQLYGGYRLSDVAE